MSVTIEHTAADGTVVTGTARGDGSAPILKAAGFRWSRNLGAWYVQGSRDRRPDTARIDRAAAALTAAGFDVTTSVDDTARPAAEREAARAARAADRADALAAKADRLADRADAEHAKADAISSMIPFGQPILVGHHSQRRHERDISRIHTATSRGWEAQRESQAAAERAAAATANQAHRHAVGTTLRRIDTLQAEGRRIDRALAGDQGLHYGPPADGTYRQRLLTRKAEIDADVAYWQGQVDEAQADGVKVWSQADFPKGTAWAVHVSGQWRRVTRANPKTLSVDASDTFGVPGYTLKYGYSQVRAARTVGDDAQRQ